MSTQDIWNTYRLQLFNYIKKQVHDAQLAKDILQDVFVKADLKKQEVKDLRLLGGWMFSITRNTIADHFRKNVKEQRVLEAICHEEPAVDQAYNACVASCLHQLINTLPEPYREALIKAEIENVPQTALASALGLSHSGAKSRVQRARKMLREKLMELYRIETDTYGNVIVCEDKVPCNCPPDIFEC